jgi:tRNA (adenine57-N1/adenine58-N1)-methyltransferase
MPNTIPENGYALIVYKDKRYFKKIEPGKSFHGTGGAINFSDLIGTEYGVKFGSYEIYKPTLEDIIMYGVRRETQIVYPKEAYHICFKLNLKNGSKIFEAGAGSGALTCIFSRMVGPEGKVVTLEKEERHYKNSRKNIERFTDWDNVELRQGDIIDFDETDFDAAFIDVREPWTVIEKVRDILKGSAYLGIIVPTTNQVIESLRALIDGFGDIEVLEIMLRRYKTIPERVRPEDRMVAHTGFLIFARRLNS